MVHPKIVGGRDGGPRAFPLAGRCNPRGQVPLDYSDSKNMKNTRPRSFQQEESTFSFYPGFESVLNQRRISLQRKISRPSVACLLLTLLLCWFFHYSPY